MKKILLLFVAIMMVSTGLWAQERKEVSYLYPVYNTEDVPASGIKEWATEEREAIILTGSDSQFTLSNQWYVITGDNVTYPKGLICNGDVHLILADGAKLTVTGDVNNAGIQVSGTGYSLTIYGQDNQSGQLITTGTSDAAGIGGEIGGNGSNITINGGAITATGGTYAAGIGGGKDGSGSNITINGGKVTANGGNNAAGIGGGANGNGSNIIINGGTVTAKGGDGAAGIGGSYLGYNSNIFIAKGCIIKADNNDPPETEITNTGDDLAGSLAGKRYVNIEIDIPSIRTAAIGEINKAIDGVTDEDVRAIANTAITNIKNATSEEDINSIKTQALKDIAFAISKIDAIAAITSASQGIKNAELNAWIDAAIKDIKNGSPEASPSIEEIKEQILYFINLFQNGKAEGKTAAFGTLSEKQNGPALIVTDKDDKEIILYSPKSVEYIKVKEE